MVSVLGPVASSQRVRKAEHGVGTGQVASGLIETRKQGMISTRILPLLNPMCSQSGCLTCSPAGFVNLRCTQLFFSPYHVRGIGQPARVNLPLSSFTQNRSAQLRFRIDDPFTDRYKHVIIRVNGGDEPGLNTDPMSAQKSESVGVDGSAGPFHSS